LFPRGDAPSSSLRIVFPRPGFFLNDPRLVITLDGLRVYEGSFVGGVDVELPVAPGPHRIETRIEIGPFARQRLYDLLVSLEGVRCTATLRYSRLWGNFTRSLTLSTG
jgi:hypothetical protein